MYYYLFIMMLTIINSDCRLTSASGSLQTDCATFSVDSPDDDYTYTIPVYWRWTAYPVPPSVYDKLSDGAIAAIVLAVLFVVGAGGYCIYIRILNQRKLQNSLLEPINSSTPVQMINSDNYGAPIQTTANRVPSGTIVRVTPHVNPAISVHDSVPTVNPIVQIATPVNINSNL